MNKQYTIVQKLLAIWLVMWLAQSLGGLSGQHFAFMALNPWALFHGDLSALPGLLLWPFTHTPFPRISHIFFNCYLVWVFGQEVEALYRGKKFILLCAASVAAGVVIRSLLCLLAPYAFAASVVGGSGLVMTMLGVQAAVYPDRQLSLILFQCRLRPFFLVLVGLDFLWLLYGFAGQGGNVAVDVHLAGAALGYWWAGGFQRLPNFMAKAQQRIKKTQTERRNKTQLNEDVELDRILAKISAHGLPSLTPEERRFLEQRSRRK